MYDPKELKETKEESNETKKREKEQSIFVLSFVLSFADWTEEKVLKIVHVKRFVFVTR